MTIRDDAKRDYLSGASINDIAEWYGKSPGTIRTWKSRYKWDTNATPQQKSTTKKRNNATLKRNTKKSDKNVDVEQINKLADDILDSELTAKQQLFVTEYLRTSNATQAYMNAYEVKYDIARASGPRLLANVSIQKTIQDVRKSQLKYIGVDIASLINDVAKEAKSDIGDYLEFASHDELVTDAEGNVQLDINDNPVVKHYSQVWVKDKDEVDTSLIKKVSVGKDGLQLELHDKTKARDKLIDWLTGYKLSKDKLDNEKRKVEIEIMKAKLKLLTNDDDKLDEPIRELIAGLDAIANGDSNG